MDKLRMRFSKTGRAVYISHLDLMHTLQRAFSRAGLKIKYSEGFNPHPAISIALPLSVGTSSNCEIMDFTLESFDGCISSVPEILNKALPEGIEVISVYVPERKTSEIKWLDVAGRFEYDNLNPAETVYELKKFFSSESLVITKKTKRGISPFDVKSAVKTVDFRAENDIVIIRAIVSAQEPTMNPELFAEALRQLAPALAPDFAAFERIEVFDKEMSVFR